MGASRLPACAWPHHSNLFHQSFHTVYPLPRTVASRTAWFCTCWFHCLDFHFTLTLCPANIHPPKNGKVDRTWGLEVQGVRALSA